jgi:WD40 repeat protein
MAWFDELNFTTIKSISFSKKKAAPAKAAKSIGFDAGDGKEEDAFSCADFLVADENALICSLQSSLFEEIKPNQKKGHTLMHGIASGICGIAVHPKETILAVAGAEGFVLLWDYRKKGDYIKNYDAYKKESFTAIEFTPDGMEILVASTLNGEIKVMDSTTGFFKKLNTPPRTSDGRGHPVKQLIVTWDGNYFAVSDTNKAVCLFKKETDPNKPAEWKFTGKILSHEVEVTSIAFGRGLDEQGQDMHRLFSIGKDRRVFEYNVYESTQEKLQVIGQPFIIEQEALPSACIWYPDAKEGLLLTANTEYKMKVWNPSAQSSRKTCLGPTYGGEIIKMKELPGPTPEEQYLVYSTAKKVIGLIKLPLDGNPNKTMGLIAHPNEITDFCASPDGRFLFTCGGDDLSVKMWSIDLNPIE